MTRPEEVDGRAVAGLLLLCIFAFAIRGLGFERVIADDMVLFAPGDAMYHLRRSFYTFVNFPAILLWDPLLNYPDGAPVPWPPLFDFLLGGVAHVFASDQRGFELIAAWVSPLWGALTLIPVWLVARRVASTGTAMLAAFLFAIFPICVNYGRVGNPDHHAAVAFVGAWSLWLLLALVDPAATRRRLMTLMPLLVIVRLAILLIWHGNLLYIALLDGCLLIAAAWSKSTTLPRVVFSSALATAILLIPILESLPLPTEGRFSSITLSGLHLAVLTGIAAMSGSLLAIERWKPGQPQSTRFAFMVLSGLVFLVFLLLIPEAREGLSPALRFVTLDDGVGHMTLEQHPLFPLPGREFPFGGERAWGYFHYLIPVAPLALFLLVRDPERRSSVVVLVLWGSVLGVLAILQRRFGNDLAPTASVSFAVLLLEVPRVLARRFELPGWGAAVVTTAAISILIAPALRDIYLPRASATVAAFKGDRDGVVQPEDTVSGNLIAFAREVERLTPKTGGFLDSDEVPNYGILAEANLGHVIHYVARRGTATDPMWAYIGPENWEMSHQFLTVSSEHDALVLAKRLRGRYVLTMDSRLPPSVYGRLHRADGIEGPEGTRLEHFRLISEAPLGALGFQNIFEQPTADASEAAPYKLFQIVKGAVIEIPGPVGRRAEVSLWLESPTGRRLRYRAHALVGDSGFAEIRVPYSTERRHPVRATGLYFARIDGSSARFEVPERAVLREERVRVEVD